MIHHSSIMVILKLISKSSLTGRQINHGVISKHDLVISSQTLFGKKPYSQPILVQLGPCHSRRSNRCEIPWTPESSYIVPVAEKDELPHASEGTRLCSFLGLVCVELVHKRAEIGKYGNSRIELCMTSK